MMIDIYTIKVFFFFFFFFFKNLDKQVRTNSADPDKTAPAHLQRIINLNIFYFQKCTLQHINNTITQRNRIGTKAYSLYSSSPETHYCIIKPNGSILNQ